MMIDVSIGVHVVREDTEITKRNFETASWWEKIAIKQGIYTIDAKEDYDGKIADTSLVVRIPGVLVDGYFPSSWGGVPISGTDPRSSVVAGEKRTHRLSPYAHALAWELLGADDPWMSSTWVLDGYAPVIHPFIYNDSLAFTAWIAEIDGPAYKESIERQHLVGPERMFEEKGWCLTDTQWGRMYH